MAGMKVYITSRGSYSDYELDRVFASRALAEDYIAFRRTADDHRINEDVIEEELIETALTGRLRYSMEVTWSEKPRYRRDTNNKWDEPYERVEAQFLGEEPAFYGDDPREEIVVTTKDSSDRSAEWHERWGAELWIRVTGWDQERVRKVFGEVKAQKAAELEGVG